jgi:hypothetical protein
MWHAILGACIGKEKASKGYFQIFKICYFGKFSIFKKFKLLEIGHIFGYPLWTSAYA